MCWIEIKDVGLTLSKEMILSMPARLTITCRQQGIVLVITDLRPQTLGTIKGAKWRATECKTELIWHISKNMNRKHELDITFKK